MPKNLTAKSYRIFADAMRSPKLFWVVFGAFLFAALWMALSGAYSMAFDEYVHYGTMQLYAHQWSPFLAHQPVSADAFGAVTRDPSYLYHYLMSFPLRVFAHFVHAFAAQIIFLRLFDVAFFASGLLMFRAALKRAGASLFTSNLALGFFMLLPVTPFMAAQVNYDDMLFLLMGATVWLAVIVARRIYEEKRLPVLQTSWLVALALLAGLVKYAYLPVLVALTGFFVVIIWRNLGHSPRAWWSALRPSLRTAKRWQLVIASIFLVLSLGLFVERYGINVVRYHTPTPECDQVMDVNRCQNYEPFARNYNYHAGHYDFPAWKVAVYPFNNWIRGMMRSLFFVVGNKESGYPAGEPLPLAHVLGYLVFVGGFVLVVWRVRWLWKRSLLNQLFLVVVAVYGSLLFLQNFMDFMHTHVAVAIQGRYLVPILPLYLVLVAQAAALTFRYKKTAWIVLAVFCVMLFEGGSLIPFVIRAHDNWLWNAPIVQHVNHAARDIVGPVMYSPNLLF